MHCAFSQKFLVIRIGFCFMCVRVFCSWCVVFDCLHNNVILRMFQMADGLGFGPHKTNCQYCFGVSDLRLVLLSFAWFVCCHKSIRPRLANGVCDVFLAVSCHYLVSGLFDLIGCLSFVLGFHHVVWCYFR